MTPVGDSVVGQLLDGRYLIDAPIARGGMSTVYRGVDRRLDRPVAIKVMDPKFAGDPQFLSRFEFEARAVAKLSDPGLVAVYDQGVDRGHPFLVMELVSGGTLRELLRERGPMPPHATAAVARPVLSALSAAHAAGLVHRDIKPENVLISDSGEVKVADFGLVRAVAAANATSSSVILGTAAYLSPEQVSTGQADTRSDVYSTGILMFETITGQTPFSGDTTLSVAYRRINEDVPPPSSLIAGVPAELDELVLRATARDPRARFANAQQVLGALETASSRLGLPRFRVPTPRRSAEHSSAAVTGRAAPAAATRVAPLPAPASGEPATAQAAGPAATTERPPRTATRQLTTASPHGPSPLTAELAGSGPAPPGRQPPGRPDVAEQRRRGRRKTWITIAVLALLAVALGVAGWWFGSGRFTTVPQIPAMTQSAATQTLSAAGLSPVVRGVYSDDKARGTLLAIIPGPGTRVVRNSEVQLNVSLGQPAVPQLTTRDVNALEKQLRDRTLVPVEGDPAYSDTVPDGAVVALSPAPGTTVATGTTVTVTTSKGPAPVRIPSVQGRSEHDARAALAAAGLKVGQVRHQFSASVDGGKAIGTDPGDGTMTSRGETVTLILSNALTVPDVSGMQPQEAMAALTEAGLQPSDAGTLSGTTADAGTIAKTTPTAGSRVDPDSPAVQVYTSDTTVVPSVTGRSVSAARDLLDGLGFDVRVHQLFHTDSSLIVTQSPPGGTALPPHSTVDLTALP